MNKIMKSKVNNNKRKKSKEVETLVIKLYQYKILHQMLLKVTKLKEIKAKN